MAKFSKDNQPTSNRQGKRGKDKKTLILEAIKKASLLGLSDKSTNDEAEEAFFSHMAIEALTGEDNSVRNTCMNALVDRGWSKVKPASEIYTFELDENADPTTQARQIMKAVSAGEIPYDVGSSLITALGTVMKIAELDEFERRLKALEQANDETETP